MRYTFDDTVSAEELFALLDRMMAFQGDRFPARNVFHVPLRDQKKEATSLENTISVTARDDDGILAGYLRILTDHAYMYYILDVMVDPMYRKLGLGRSLLDLAVGECKKRGFMKIFLTAIPGTEPFYGRFGFKPGMSPVLTIRGEDYPQPQA